MNSDVGVDPVPRATAGDDNFYWLRIGKSLPGPPDAFIDKAVAGDFVGPVNIAKVDEDRLRHYFLQPLEIESAKLLPFGNDNQRGGALGT